jgi:hypothetical protein
MGIFFREARLRPGWSGLINAEFDSNFVAAMVYYRQLISVAGPREEIIP